MSSQNHFTSFPCSISPLVVYNLEQLLRKKKFRKLKGCLHSVWKTPHSYSIYHFTSESIPYFPLQLKLSNPVISAPLTCSLVCPCPSSGKSNFTTKIPLNVPFQLSSLTELWSGFLTAEGENCSLTPQVLRSCTGKCSYLRAHQKSVPNIPVITYSLQKDKAGLSSISPWQSPVLNVEYWIQKALFQLEWRVSRSGKPQHRIISDLFPFPGKALQRKKNLS